jgi:AraC-like DNA-binding protein
MLTAKAGIDNKIIGLETGADDYLTKPFNVEELLVRIKNLIEQRLKLREYYKLKKFEINPKEIAVTSIDQKFLEKTLSLFENRFYDSSFSVPQMQESLGMSKTQLYRKLKALTNESPGELLRNFRLKRAAHLIAEKADSISQIAYNVGFNSVPYFTKCFKGLYGVTPSSYTQST